MWADAKRDGRPAECRRRPLRKFRNSIPCTTSESLAKTGITTTIKLTTSNMQRCNLQHATSDLQQTLSHLPKNLQVARNGAESEPGWVRRRLGDS